MQYLWDNLRRDLPDLAILGLLLGIVVWSVMLSGWVEGLSILPVILLVGLVTSYLLTIARFPEPMAVAFTSVYGWFTVWMLAGRFVAAPLSLRQRLLEINFRLAVWLEQAIEGGFSRDNLIFLVLVGLLAWHLTFNAVWSFFRARRLWRATIPAGLALVINAYYYFGPLPIDLFVGAFVFLVLTLAVRSNALIREQVWQQAGAGFRPGLRFDLLKGGLAAVVGLTLLAWVAPTAPASDRLAALWERSDNPWMRVQETFERLFNAVEGSATATPTYYGGATLSMGGPINLSNAPVMVVYAPEGYRYYWRSKVFDTYAGGRWWSNVDARANSDFGLLRQEEQGTYLLRQNVQQRFQMVVPATRLVYAAPQPLSFSSLPITYDLIFTTPSEEYATVASALSRRLLETGDIYGAISSISIADETSLRAAGTDYPAWVRERYLALPPSVTARTRRLSDQIAAGHDNPYDVARAIESYLRQNIAYNDQVPAPPEDAEPVDYLLFERREGYCVYYASAMAVLLRAQGIPARVAAGFAQGALDPEINGYVVAESDAHTWVEAYFPSYGWIEFEPTAGRDPIVRAERTTLQNLSALDPEPLEREGFLPVEPGGVTPEQPIETSGPGLPAPRQSLIAAVLPAVLRGLVLMGLLLAGLGVAAWYWLEQRGTHGLSEVARSYARLNVYAPWVGVELAPSDTPYERAETLGRAAPPGEKPIRKIVDLYVREQYTADRLGNRRAEANRQSREAWKAARRSLVGAGLRRRLRRFNPLRGRGITVR